MSLQGQGLHTSSAARTDDRTTRGTSTAITIEYPLPETHPAYNSNCHNPRGCINILTIDDVSWFKRRNGEWRGTTALQPFLDIGDIQINRGIVIGNIGDTAYRHGRVERFLRAVESRGWIMIVERLRAYTDRINGRSVIAASNQDLVQPPPIGEDSHNDNESHDNYAVPDSPMATLSHSSSNTIPASYEDLVQHPIGENSHNNCDSPTDSDTVSYTTMAPPGHSLRSDIFPQNFDLSAEERVVTFSHLNAAQLSIIAVIPLEQRSVHLLSDELTLRTPSKTGR